MSADVYVVSFSQGIAHIRDRASGECIYCIPIAAYEIIRLMAFDEVKTTLKKPEVNPYQSTTE